ncbi:MAG: phosphohistidine phosphatase SixA [Phycisphaerales bacterium]|nr:phosphohistidine phosphatase SixA [Phycisphaerales bacterium]
MTTLYLCRHAIAAEPVGIMTDADRPLTPDGAKKFRKSAHGLAKLLDKGGGDSVTHIFTSPLVRARQTAEILAEAFAVPVKVTAALDIPGNLKQLIKEIRALKNVQGIIAVGHEPTLSDWLGELCFDQPGRVELKKGAVAAIELARTDAKGQLLWMIQPGILRHL